MANRFKGETSVVVGDTRYTLRLDFNALCAFEEATGHNALAFLERMEDGVGAMSVRDMRALVLAMLQGTHPEATLALAGEVLSTDVEALGRAVAAASPETAPGNPPAGQGAR